MAGQNDLVFSPVKLSEDILEIYSCSILGQRFIVAAVIVPVPFHDLSLTRRILLENVSLHRRLRAELDYRRQSLIAVHISATAILARLELSRSTSSLPSDWPPSFNSTKPTTVAEQPNCLEGKADGKGGSRVPQFGGPFKSTIRQCEGRKLVGMAGFEPAAP
jgi:hypothetical protein